MENNQLKSSEEEIDLLYYFRLFKEAIQKLGKGIRSYLQLLWRNLVLFLLIISLVTGFAYCLRYIILPAYNTDGMFISHFLPADFHVIMIQDLDELRKEQNFTSLAEQIQVSPQVAAQIMRIELQPLRDTVLERNDTVFSPFRINLLLSDTNHLEEIQQGLIYYLEGGEAEKKRKLGRAFSSEQEKIEVVRPFLKRSKFNYPNYKAYLIKGFLAAIILALVIIPIAGKKKKNKAESA